MILSDRDIRARLRTGELAIEPLSDEALQIQPASVDLRLGREFLVYRPAQVTVLDPGDPAGIAASMDRVLIEPELAFVLHPGEFALGTTIERVKMPSDLVGMVDGRSSIGRLAVVVHATAGFIDPGFEGQVTLELSNIGSIAVKLYPGLRIAQIVMHQLSSPAELPYGLQRGSHYQLQTGPQASQIRLDR
jgi:dCTP deaminase